MSIFNKINKYIFRKKDIRKTGKRNINVKYFERLHDTSHNNTCYNSKLNIL